MAGNASKKDIKKRPSKTANIRPTLTQSVFARLMLPTASTSPIVSRPEAGRFLARIHEIPALPYQSGVLTS
jgi:hypothetical protein